MKTRPFMIFVFGTAMALVFVWAAAAQATEVQSHIMSNSDSLSVIKDYQNYENTVYTNDYPSITSTQTFSVYLPLVYVSIISPCSIEPTLISPTNGSAVETLLPSLVYLNGTDSVEYSVIKIADNPAFDTPIQYNIGAGIGPRHVWLWENLNPATTYYWHVYDVCGADVSPNSLTFAFTTGSGGVILPAPTLISPPNGLIGLGHEITLTWGSVEGAVQYKVIRCYIGGGSCFHYLTSETSWWTTRFDPNTTYEWYVNGQNDYAYGNQSSVWQFSTGSFTPMQESMANFQVEVSDVLFHPYDWP
jgi:hypothetical protein